MFDRAKYKLYFEILPLEEHSKSKAALENHSAKRIAERNGRIGGLPKHNSHEPLVAALAIRRKKERFKHRKRWHKHTDRLMNRNSALKAWPPPRSKG